MGILKTAARAAVASSVHGRVQRRQQQRWAQPIPPASAPAPEFQQPPAAPAPVEHAPSASGTAEQLQLLAQLGELRQSGILTEEEFEQKKAKILSQ